MWGGEVRGWRDEEWRCVGEEVRGWRDGANELLILIYYAHVKAFY